MSRSVMDVAQDVGYDSPEAFTKAFKRFHGVTPSECKTGGRREFLPLQVKLVLTQTRPLAYTLAEKARFYLCGSTAMVPSEDSNATSYLWAQCEMTGYLDRCFAFPGYETLVGVSTPEGYTVKAKCREASADTSHVIPPHTWAVFPCEGIGPIAILRTWDLIYSSWIPKTSHEIMDLPQLEVYQIQDGGYTCEIWIAVK